jgi:hypothetical protein
LDKMFDFLLERQQALIHALIDINRIAHDSR